MHTHQDNAIVITKIDHSPFTHLQELKTRVLEKTASLYLAEDVRHLHGS